MPQERGGAYRRPAKASTPAYLNLMALPVHGGITPPYRGGITPSPRAGWGGVITICYVNPDLFTKVETSKLKGGRLLLFSSITVGHYCLPYNRKVE